MNSLNTRRIATLLRTARERCGLAVRDVARRSGVSAATLSRLEHAQLAKPDSDKLRAVARVIGITESELFDIPETELPTFQPYLRSKYRELPDEAVAEIEAVFARVARDYGLRGPKQGEDEQP